VQYNATVCADGATTRCKNETCSKRTNFGYAGASEVPIYCITCIPNNLKSKRVDVRNKRCERKGCRVRPSFGYMTDTVSPTSNGKKYLNYYVLDALALLPLTVVN
jgi:hypothetical protein